MVGKLGSVLHLGTLQTLRIRLGLCEAEGPSQSTPKRVTGIDPRSRRAEVGRWFQASSQSLAIVDLSGIPVV